MNLASTPAPVPPQTLAERLERLVAAVPGLITELSLEGVLQRVADLAAELLEARYAEWVARLPHQPAVHWED